MVLTHQHVRGPRVFLTMYVALFVCQICHSTKLLEVSLHPLFMVWRVSAIDDRQFIPGDLCFFSSPLPLKLHFNPLYFLAFQLSPIIIFHILFFQFGHYFFNFIPGPFIKILLVFRFILQLKLMVYFLLNLALIFLIFFTLLKVFSLFNLALQLKSFCYFLFLFFTLILLIIYFLF